MNFARTIWTNQPDAIAVGEVSIELKLRRELATILFRESAERNLRPVDVIADIVENVLLIIDAPNDPACDEKLEAMMEKIWG